jgi:phenylacetate-coenzyme A ligase PaaK-like adenylate-forming protein
MKETKERKMKENLNKIKTTRMKQRIKKVKKESSIYHRLSPESKSQSTIIFYKSFLLNCNT